MTRHRFAAIALLLLVTPPLVSLLIDRRERGPFEREEWERSYTKEDEKGNELILQDENGVTAHDAHFKALMQRQRMLEGAPIVAGDAGVTRTSWTSLGPQFSGRIRTIVIHPTRTTHMLVGAASGGVFKSTDAGVTWRPVNDYLPAMAIRTLAINPINHEQVYAGTGEVVRGIGLLRSNDFGETWQHVSGSESMATVQRIRFAPDGTLYAGSENGLYRTTDGTTFTRLHPGGTDEIEIDPSNPSHLIVSAYFDRKKVIARFDGSTWTTSTGAPTEPGYFDFIELAYAPSNPQIVYALTSELSRGGFYRSDDGGASFRLIPNGPYAYGSWASALWVNPFDSNSVVAGGVSLRKTTDGGVTWNSAWSFTSCTPREVCIWGPVDHHEVVAHPSFDNVGNRSLYLVADQGVFRLPDIHGDGLEARIDGLVTMQFYAAVVDQGSGRILAGTQDMGTHLLIDGVSTPGGAGPGDGGFDVIDPRNPDLFYITIRSSTDRLQLFRMLGVNLSTRKVDPLMRCNEPTYRLPDACESLGNPESPVVMDLRAPDRLYAGGLRLWRTDNATEAVSPASGPTWTNLALPGERTRNFISAIAVSPHDSDVVWVARNFGEVFRTTNATAAAPTWVRVGESQLPLRYPTRVAIASQDPRMIYVTFGGYAANVWRTFDNGETWENVSGSGATALPEAPVRDLAIHPATNGAHWIYAATEVGLFASENAGQTWSVPSAGPAAVRIDDLVWHNQDLILATHGRGLWRATVGNPMPMTTPGAPVSFKASVAAGTLSASWEQSPIGATPQQYMIQAALNADFNPILQTLPTGTATSFSLPGVPPGIFFLRVVAQTAAGTSPPSNTQAIGGTAPLLPGAPSQLNFTLNGNALTLNWLAPTSGGTPTTYYIDAGTGAGLSNIASLATGNTLTWFSVTAPNGQYFVRVRAANAAGTSGASNEVSFIVGCTLPPPNPTNLQASVAGATIALTWAAPVATVIGYRLEAGTAPGLSNIAVVDTGSPATSFSGSAPPGTYFVRVKALNTCGASPASPEVTIVVR